MATGIILLTYLALWLQYTPADATGVDGMQFRYFLPLSGTRRIRIYSRTFRSRRCTGLSTTVSAITANSSAASNVAPNISTLIPAYDHPSVGTGILGPISTLDSGECTK